jgi:hypothetical protein
MPEGRQAIDSREPSFLMSDLGDFCAAIGHVRFTPESAHERPATLKDVTCHGRKTISHVAAACAFFSCASQAAQSAEAGGEDWNSSGDFKA